MRGISAIVPLYNEEDNVVLSYQEITSVLQALEQGVVDPTASPDGPVAANGATPRMAGMPYEVIFVDDGSKDRSVERLMGVAAGDPHVRIVQFRRNFGQTAAMAAGFDEARYDIVVTLDGDLQNDPHEIPKMIAKLDEGYDMVAGWRKHRQDKFFSRKLPSMIANRLISWATNVRLHDYGCTLKVMTAEIAKGIKLYGEMHRFIPALAGEMGARIAEVPVNHRARQFGTSKYGISRTLRVILDLVTVKFLLGFSKRPIHLFGTVGLVSSGLGALTLLVMTYQRMFLHQPMGNRPLLSLGVMLVIIGLQFLVFGLLAEVLARTYYESQDKRIYVVRRRLEPGRTKTAGADTTWAPDEQRHERGQWSNRVAGSR